MHYVSRPIQPRPMQVVRSAAPRVGTPPPTAPQPDSPRSFRGLDPDQESIAGTAYYVDSEGNKLDGDLDSEAERAEADPEPEEPAFQPGPGGEPSSAPSVVAGPLLPLKRDDALDDINVWPSSPVRRARAPASSPKAAGLALL